jgi:hypothetical protein
MQMKLTINRHLFTQTNLDSGSLTMLSCVAHRISEPGEYQAIVLRDNKIRTSFSLSAADNFVLSQLSIDLATINQSVKCCDSSKPPTKNKEVAHFAINPKVHVVFYVSSGRGEYMLDVGRLDDGKRVNVFDNRELNEGDLYIATIIRPGTYTVTNVTTGATGKIIVAYPKIGKERYSPGLPVSIECTENRMDPDTVRIGAMQGLTYNIRTRSRIKIDLLEPDDGPKTGTDRGIR